MTPDLVGSVAVVIGASKGIGAGTALMFARAGAAVVLAARDEAAVRRLAEKITAAGGRARGLRADATDPDSMAEVVEVAVSTYGGLHLAFNNATDGPMPAPLADIDIDEFDRGIATNVRGTFLGMKYQVPAMLATDDGLPKAVVNMASGAALHPVANLAAYVAGKATIIGLTKWPPSTTPTAACASTSSLPGPSSPTTWKLRSQKHNAWPHSSPPCGALAPSKKLPAPSPGCARRQRRSSTARWCPSTEAKAPATSRNGCTDKEKG
jgi:NADP-dependent 3-hydroxy acid dehydrogenase YdfG